MRATFYLQRYYDHLFTLSGGTLNVSAEKLRLFGQWVYQARVRFLYDGVPYLVSWRLREEVVLSFDWGHPDHVCVYQLATTIRDILKTLKEKGCEHAILEAWSKP